MDQQTKILEFVSFCIEMYAEKQSCSGQEVSRCFTEYGVLEYLVANYEALHTQGLGYTLSMIEEYISKQGPKS